MRKIFDKRGELTTQQIVVIIILIVSFIVLLYFMFQLDFRNESDGEICRNSVVLRASSQVPADSVPLKCSRSDVCITSDGSCDGMVNPEKFKVKSKEEVYEVLANEMADCWWMYGQGKYDYIGDTTLKKNYCSICSQVLFDDSLGEDENIGGVISKDELYNYLQDNDVASEERVSYLEYIFRERDVDKLKEAVLQSEGNSEGVATFGTIESGKRYYVVMGITSKIGNTYKWLGGGIAVAGVVLTAPLGIVGFVGGAIIVGSGAAVGFAGDDVAGLFEPEIGALIVKGDGIPNNFMAPTIIEVNSEKFKALNCKEVVSFS